MFSAFRPKGQGCGVSMPLVHVRILHGAKLLGEPARPFAWKDITVQAVVRGGQGPVRGALDECSFQDLLMPGFRLRVSAHGGVDSRWRCAARLLDLICLGADAADFDCPLWMWVKQRLLSSPGSRRSNLHVERHRAALRSTGRGSTSATRLEASLRTFGDMEDSRDPWFEPRCQRARLSFRPLC